MGKHKTIGRFNESHNPENARGYFVQNEIGVTVAGPFQFREDAWKEQDRLDAQAEAEAQRSGARPVDPIACATEIAHLWLDESIAARTRHHGGHLPSLDRLQDCECAVREISIAIASQNAFPGLETLPEHMERVAKDAEKHAHVIAPGSASWALRVAFLRLLAKDTADRLSGAIAMDYPLPVLP